MKREIGQTYINNNGSFIIKDIRMNDNECYYLIFQDGSSDWHSDHIFTYSTLVEVKVKEIYRVANNSSCLVGPEFTSQERAENHALNNQAPGTYYIVKVVSKIGLVPVTTEKMQVIPL